MKKTISALLGALTVTTLALSAFAQGASRGGSSTGGTSGGGSAPGGEVGNEERGEDGQPMSLESPCSQRMSWIEFQKESLLESGYADVFKMVREIYPPLYRKLVEEDTNLTVCKTEEPIESIFRSLPPISNPRMALWARQGDGDRDVIVIQTTHYYNSAVNPVARALTMMRERFHPLFFQAFGGQVHTDLMKRELMSDFRSTFLAKTEDDRRARYPGIVARLKRYGFFRFFGTLAESCAVSVADCQNTYEALVTLSLNETGVSYINPLSGLHAGMKPVPAQSARYLVAKHVEKWGPHFSSESMLEITTWIESRTVVADGPSEIQEIEKLSREISAKNGALATTTLR
jgi:hypothetical protein